MSKRAAEKRQRQELMRRHLQSPAVRERERHLQELQARRMQGIGDERERLSVQELAVRQAQRARESEEAVRAQRTAKKPSATPPRVKSPRSAKRNDAPRWAERCTHITSVVVNPVGNGKRR